jgi:ectoine hydroxylase-related dioxygenase (phytanoyl-CoA dioxygenase family)
MAETRFPLLDFDEFHRQLAGRLAASNGALARRALFDDRTIALRVPGCAGYTYRCIPGSIEVVDGTDEATTVVEISAESWSDYAHELRTGFGLLYAKSLQCPVGQLQDFIAWDPAIRAMYSGRPVYQPGGADLVDAEGTPLDLAASFTMASDRREMRHFLQTTGYLHVRGVFDGGEVSGFRRETERLAAAARPGDDRSWWAKARDGADVCCRLTYVNDRSDILARVQTDDRLAELVAAMADDGVTLAIQNERGDGNSVVIKNPNVVEGLSDLPWHVDCGLGGHPVMCPGLNVGVQLDAASAAAGQLHFLAGSNGRTAVHLPAGVLTDASYPTVAVTTEPGDVTVHYTDTLHASPAPTGDGPGRRALYLSWNNPLMAEFIPPGQGFNDIVLRSGEGNRVLTVSEQLAG